MTNNQRTRPPKTHAVKCWPRWFAGANLEPPSRLNFFGLSGRDLNAAALPAPLAVQLHQNGSIFSRRIGWSQGDPVGNNPIVEFMDELLPVELQLTPILFQFAFKVAAELGRHIVSGLGKPSKPVRAQWMSREEFASSPSPSVTLDISKS